MIIFGCCGVLDEVEVQDKIIIPSSTIRDEGTSYHYLPAGRRSGWRIPAPGYWRTAL